MSKHSQRKSAEPTSTASVPTFIEGINLWILALIQVVCPLLFFTNLTRNPYFTQIALLNIGIALVSALVAAKLMIEKKNPFARLPIHWPLLCFLTWALISTGASWISHPLLRDGIQYEGTRIWVFTAVNMVMAVYLPLMTIRPFSPEKKPLNIWVDIILGILWSLMWIEFHSLKDPLSQKNIWDPYGAILWIGAGAYAIWRIHDRRMEGVFHVIFAVAIVSGLYGLSQYAGWDVIWSGTVMPYGGRPVSSFGNPNFLSSYVMMVVPLSMAFSFQSTGGNKSGYIVVSVFSILSTLSTLTRSSYVGLLAALVFFAAMMWKLQPGALKKIAFTILFVCGLVVLFPKTPVSKTQSPVARFTEILEAKKTGAVYGPWHQRILIWSSAVDMVIERPLLGKGWGCFELFYPYYQGKYLLYEKFAPLRTHANNAHNILLELLSQVGLVGTGLAIWIFVSMMIFGLKLFRQETHMSKKILISGSLAALFGMVVDNFFGNVSIFFAVPAFLFWWVAGALFVESDSQKERRLNPVALNKQGMVLLGLVMVISASSIVYYIKRWNQERYYFEGFKYSRTDRVVDSIKSLEKAFSWFGGEVNGNYELGNIYARYAKSLSDQKRFDESRVLVDKAMGAYESAIRANPGYDEIYFNLGVTRLQSGDKKEAIRELETALLINPLLQSAYNSLGNFYLQDQKFDEAVRIYGQAVQVFPKEKDYWNNLGFAQAQQGHHDSAFQSFQKAIEIDPSFQSAKTNLQTTAQKLGQSLPQ